MAGVRVELGNGKWYSEKWYSETGSSIQKLVKERKVYLNLVVSILTHL